MLSFLVGIALLSLAAAQQPEEQTVVTTAAPIIYEIEYPAEEAGSGGGEPMDECKLTYIKFDRYYLRGVKEPNYISINGSSFEHCEKMCCYEKSMECKSFSYFAALKVCFLMNVTEDYSEKVQMIKAGGWTHVVRVADRVVTTNAPKPTTIAQEETTTAAVVVEETSPYSYYYEYGSGSDPEGSGYHDRSHSVPEETTTTSVFNSPSWRGDKRFTTPTTPTSTEKENRNPFGGSFEEPDGSEQDKLIALEPCSLRCLNDGVCQIRADKNGMPKSMCKCADGFSGNNCEDEVTTAGGFPAWIIVIIVLGSIILILFLTVFIMYQIYRRKTGEYKVVKQIQKWTRRGKKPKKETGNPEDYANPEAGQTSPTTSVQSIHGSVTSSTTHSTTTSV